MWIKAMIGAPGEHGHDSGKRDSLIIANKRNSVMEMSTIKFEVTDEEILGYDVADEALEAAACGNEKAGAITLAFCSGLDTCPA
jgi:hypothetical protein